MNFDDLTESEEEDVDFPGNCNPMVSFGMGPPRKQTTETDGQEDFFVSDVDNDKLDTIQISSNSNSYKNNGVK